MAFNIEENKAKFIQRIVDKIHKNLSKSEAKLCSEFFRQLYGTVAYEDLVEHSIEDLYGSVVNFWYFVVARSQDESKIRIYNPEFEQHGWQSTHTIIEIIHGDMPFLIDSIRMEINRLGMTIHLIVHTGGMKIVRENKKVRKILPFTTAQKQDIAEEAPIYVEINRQTDPKILADRKRNLAAVLDDVENTVKDWQKMSQKLTEAIQNLEQHKAHLDPIELEESKDFLHWIENDHFTFLGLRDYELVKEKGEQVLRIIPNSGLGVLRGTEKGQTPYNLMQMTPEARKLALSGQILIISKTSKHATVHRPTYTDYIGIKRFDSKGKVIGERRIVGLYTSVAYNTNPKHIPFLRRKVETVMKNTNVSPKSHAGKELLNIIETLPRDDLFQASTAELYELVMGIFHLQERRKIRLFTRKDIYNRFISCLVYIPKERYNTILHNALQQVLQRAFNATEILYSTRFSESVLARIHFTVRIESNKPIEYDARAIEKQLVEVARSWHDDLSTYLLGAYSEEKANQLINKYMSAFPASYREDFTARTAIYDIKHIQRLSLENTLEINFYQPVNARGETIRLKVYQLDKIIPLSDVLPILENMGLRVISEHPYEIKLGGDTSAWVNDFGMEYDKGKDIHFDEIKDLLQQAFIKIWFGHAGNDSLNKLVLKAGLAWREISVLRAYARYLRQLRFNFSQDYIENTLTNHQHLAKRLVALFALQFDPQANEERTEQLKLLQDQTWEEIDKVSNLDEDRILKRYLDLTKATLRTNYYQTNDDGSHKAYLSFKFDSQMIPEMPKPVMLYEIFVYSTDFEGVHLRGGKVARGGIRWSDRPEDFYSEIKGLVKAQQVKNAVIVPTGAKGGFVPRNIATLTTREEILNNGIYCYRMLIRGLLDLTDNLMGDKVVKPKKTVCYDGDDPYLVVAADKGTATFSDIANEIAKEYQYWLGDAFASGGSTGYDHKKMGITARGAWESVKRHFRELDINIQTTDFTVVGIGDMAGDVFGNGMLLSKKIKLVAAFNHMHIFIDPNPVTTSSFKERERLFKTPRSTWDDYNRKLISKGGGVFLRSAKSIKLSPEMKARFDVNQDAMIPNEFIQVILRTQVDLLWCGGIGTYVKSSFESHVDIGDKMNESTRINADELRCKVVGEGANLTFSQLARIEYANNDGLIYSDFIDNSAGVDCSDHEVNIKVLLGAICADEDMTIKQRNNLLSQMTKDVASLVLYNNYKQSQAISLATYEATQDAELTNRYIKVLKQKGKIDTSSVYLPKAKTSMSMSTYSADGILNKPALASLLSYSKILIKQELLASDVPEDPYLSRTLVLAFPHILRERYRTQMESHSLRRQIIATQVSNILVNEMGFTFAYRLSDETDASFSSIICAYTICRSIFNMSEIWKKIESLDNIVTASSQLEVMTRFTHLLRRASHWLLKNRYNKLDIASEVKYFAEGIVELKSCLPAVLGQREANFYNARLKQCKDWGIPEDLTKEIAVIRFLFFAHDIIEIATQLKLSIKQVASTFFSIGEYLELDWVREKLVGNPRENHWETLAQVSLRDEFNKQQRLLTILILKNEFGKRTVKSMIEQWMKDNHVLLERWQKTLTEFKASTTLNFTMLYVATRVLFALTQSSQTSHSLL